MNLLLCGLLQQAVLVTFAIKQIDARDSKISPELRTYSKFEDELKAIRNRPPSSSARNPIDSAGSDGVDKFLSKESDSGEIESIENEDELSTPTTVRLELNKAAVDSQITLPDSSYEIKPANETRNSNSNQINQTTGDRPNSSGESGSSDQKTADSNETTPTSNATTSRPTGDLISEQPSSTTTSSFPDRAPGTERTTTSGHLAGRPNGHLSQSTEEPDNQTAIPLDRAIFSPSDSSTMVPIETLSTTTPNPTESSESGLDLAGNRPNDSSNFTQKPCYTFDELESMVSRCHCY